MCISAWHDGYSRLDDPVVHHRTVAWWPRFGVAVLDRLICRQAHAVRSTLPCAPGIELNNDFRLGPATVRAIGAWAITVEETSYSPNLGTKVPARALVQAHPAIAPEAVFGWGIFRDGARVVGVTGGDVVLEAAGERHAFRVSGGLAAHNW